MKVTNEQKTKLKKLLVQISTSKVEMVSDIYESVAKETSENIAPLNSKIEAITELIGSLDVKYTTKAESSLSKEEYITLVDDTVKLLSSKIDVAYKSISDVTDSVRLTDQEIEKIKKEIEDLWWSRKTSSGAGIPIVKSASIVPVSKAFTYSGYKVTTMTSDFGTKTFTYNASNKLISIVGTGSYRNKNFTYSGNTLTKTTVS